MQQRRLRLGDILDDYCPRERRVTNHAVVAMIDDQVKQTRCTTCDAEHEFKAARVPSPRRRKDAGALAEMADGAPRPVKPGDSHDAEAFDEAYDSDQPDTSDFDAPDSDSTRAGSTGSGSGDAPALMADAAGEASAEALDDEDRDEDRQPSFEDDGPVHRRLIRATLPRPEGQAPEWKEPEFTIRQPGGRNGGREIDGNRPGGGGSQGQRPGGGRHRRGRGGPGGGQGMGQGQGQGQPRFGGPRHGQSRQGSGQGHGQGQGPRQNGGRPGGGGQPAGNRGANRQGDQRGPGRKRGR